MALKKIVIMAVVALTAHVLLNAQTYGTQAKDSIIERTPIFEELAQAESAGQVVIHQSKDIQDLVLNHSLRNATKKMSGFRVRIFFDSNQKARQQSESTATNFTALYPDVPVYRVYENIYYKVAVGDFRTKSDAMRFLRAIKKDYPSAFIIKENINYPSL